MRYQGSKRRIAKHLIPILTKDRTEGQWFVEPFCGGCNVIDKVAAPRLASDDNPYLIAMWKAVQDGWVPPHSITKSQYNHIKDNRDKYKKHLVGFVGFGSSWGSKWFGGYARSSNPMKGHKDKRWYDKYISLSTSNGLRKQKPLLNGVVFDSVHYEDLDIPPNSIIYCDPPYENTLGYKGTNDFDHSRFWQWCREKTIGGHKVFISELKAPKDFKEVWSAVDMSGPGNQRLKRVEKLFVYDGDKNE